jgi:hypothetical protein
MILADRHFPERRGDNQPKRAVEDAALFQAPSAVINADCYEETRACLFRRAALLAPAFGLLSNSALPE